MQKINKHPTWEDLRAYIRTPLEEVEAISMTLYNALCRIENHLHKHRNTEFNWGIGDFIKAKADHPVLIKYVYAEGGLIQGYRAGPLLVLRLRPDSEKAVELFLDIDEALETSMPIDVLSHLKNLRETIRKMEHDLNLDLEFEIPQDLIDNLSINGNPCALRTGTMTRLTRPTGTPVTEDTLISLTVYESASEWRERFKDLVRSALNAQALMFNARKPKMETSDAPSREDAKATQYDQPSARSR